MTKNVLVNQMGIGQPDLSCCRWQTYPETCGRGEEFDERTEDEYPVLARRRGWPCFELTNCGSKRCDGRTILGLKGQCLPSIMRHFPFHAD